MVGFQDKLWVVGGNDGQVLKSVISYDFSTQSWEREPDMRSRRDELSVTLGPDGKIYAIGGYGGQER